MPTPPTAQDITQAVEFAKRLVILLACIAVAFVAATTVIGRVFGWGATGTAAMMAATIGIFAAAKIVAAPALAAYRTDHSPV